MGLKIGARQAANEHGRGFAAPLNPHFKVVATPVLAPKKCMTPDTIGRDR
jgi:hypothetical protein